MKKTDRVAELLKYTDLNPSQIAGQVGCSRKLVYYTAEKLNIPLVKRPAPVKRVKRSKQAKNSLRVTRMINSIDKAMNSHEI